METIMIFDDDTDFVAMLEEELSQKPWQVVSYKTVNNISQLVRHHKPSLILMDNYIPDTSGVDATRELKANEEFAGIPIIFITGDPQVNELAFQAVADFALSKPVNIDMLLGTINKAFRRRSA